jgi:hypothetical protein
MWRGGPICLMGQIYLRFPPACGARWIGGFGLGCTTAASINPTPTINNTNVLIRLHPPNKSHRGQSTPGLDKCRTYPASPSSIPDSHAVMYPSQPPSWQCVDSVGLFRRDTPYCLQTHDGLHNIHPSMKHTQPKDKGKGPQGNPLSLCCVHHR